MNIEVLDHGWVKLRNIAGPQRRTDMQFDADDVDPANSARMSFGKMSDVVADDRRELDLKLADYLMRNKHTTPFEMIEVWLEMKLPIFVARQFVRHRTVSINEISGRYVILPSEWYIPEVVGGKTKSAKQGQENNLPHLMQEQFKGNLNDLCKISYDLYRYSISQGIAPEHARMCLHLNHYTHWLWKQDLHNMMHFLSLRDHSHAQVEAQEYAKAVDQLIRSVLPNLMELYDKYRKL